MNTNKLKQAAYGLFFFTYSLLANAEFIGQNVPATNIYTVDYARGNDTTGNGTDTKPWKTNAKACASVTKPNSIIYIRGVGTQETVQCVLPVGVSIKCEKQTTYIKATSALAPMIALFSPSQGTYGGQSITGCTLDGNSRVGSSAIEVKGRSFVNISNNNIKDWDDHGVDFGGLSTSGADNLTNVQVASTFAVGNIFSNNICTNSAKFSGYGRGCLQIGSQDGMLISYNTMSQLGRGGGNQGWPIKFLRGGGFKDLKILNNNLSRDALNGDNFNFTIELTGLFGKSEIAYNVMSAALDVNGIFTNTNDVALDFHDNTVGPSAYNTICTTAGCNSIGVIIEFSSSNIWIRNNVFKNLKIIVDNEFHNGGVNQREIHVENNLGIGICQVTAMNTGGTNNSLVNVFFQQNTFYAASSGLCGGATYGISLAGLPTRSIVIRNNILVGFNIYGIWFYSGDYDRVTVDNNLYYNNGSNLNKSGVNITNFNETNALTGDPLFVNGSGLFNTPLDFKIQTGSPAKYTGYAGTLPIDITNNARQLQTSIGAFEF